MNQKLVHGFAFKLVHPYPPGLYTDFSEIVPFLDSGKVFHTTVREKHRYIIQTVIMDVTHIPFIIMVTGKWLFVS